MRRLLSFLAISFIVFTVWIIREADSGRKNVLLRIPDTLKYGDKIGHFFIAGALALAANHLLNYRTIKLGKLVVPAGTLIVLILALCEESSQYFIESRNLELLDALVNTTAILLFSIPAFRRIRRSRAN